MIEFTREQRERELADMRAKVLGRLPEQFRARSGAEMLAAIKCPEHREVARRWDWGQPGCILSGPSRVGKTTAAACLFRRILATHSGRWQALRWGGSLRLVKASQEARQRPARDGVDDMALYERASLLVLDDLGQEPRSDWSLEILHELLEVRYGRGLPTIATTELGKIELFDRYGTATMARILESGGQVGKVLEAAKRAA